MIFYFARQGVAHGTWFRWHCVERRVGWERVEREGARTPPDFF